MDDYEFAEYSSDIDYGTDAGSADTFVSGGSWNAAQFLPVAQQLASGGGGSPTYQPVGAFGGIAAAGAGVALALGSRLAAMFGRGAGSAVINGVKFSMSSLWPYIRKYGPTSVATALGISLAQLGTLAMAAPQQARKRRRGISASDIRRTKRVIRFNRQLSRQLGTNRSSRRYYGGGARRHAHYFN